MLHKNRNCKNRCKLYVKPNENIKESCSILHKEPHVTSCITSYCCVQVENFVCADIVVGAPGSDKVFVLYVRPVIHSKVVMRADPDVFNLTTPSASYSALCDNQSAVCSSITVCFSLMASGDIASTVRECCPPTFFIVSVF